jgi:hypothetical protein
VVTAIYAPGFVRNGPLQIERLVATLMALQIGIGGTTGGAMDLGSWKGSDKFVES